MHCPASPDTLYYKADVPSACLRSIYIYIAMAANKDNSLKRSVLTDVVMPLVIVVLAAAYVATSALPADAKHWFLSQRRSIMLALHKSPEVRGVSDTTSAPPNFIHILPDLISAFEDDTIPEADTSSAGTGGETNTGGGGGNVQIDDAAFMARAGAPSSSGYYQMPDPVNGEYVVAHPWNRCGSAALIQLLNRAAIQWNAKYPDSTLEIWDLNADGHASHRNGIDVDVGITNLSAANLCSDFYDQPGNCGGGLSEGQCRSVELGKMFLSTNQVQMIFYDDEVVNNAVMAYARESEKTNFVVMEPWGTQACNAGHHDHFHVRVLDEYRLPTSSGC